MSKYKRKKRRRAQSKAQDKKQVKRARDYYKKAKKLQAKPQKEKYPILTLKLKKWISAIIFLLLGTVIVFAFFNQAGKAGRFILNNFDKAIGKTVFFVPFLCFLAALLIIKPQKKRVLAPVVLAICLLLTSISGILGAKPLEAKEGGWLGYAAAWPLANYFGFTVALIVLSVLCIIGLLIIWEFLPKKKKPSRNALHSDADRAAIKQAKELKPEQKEPETLKPKFRIKPIEIPALSKAMQTDSAKAKKEKPENQEPASQDKDYKIPPLDLFDTAETQAAAGDIEYNALVIKKTLQNFGIEVEMTEAHIGPTVTQYTLKPAEGVKLAKIIALNNDLALALAAHPIRIEAPIPGKALVGIEVPNKQRALVKMGHLLASKEFLESEGSLVLGLGKDVMGRPICPSLGRMPHLLVAGATGSGKTICLNSLILSLIYRNSPKILRFILIDPKRVEFPVYGNLPHLLTPVIFNSQKAVNALNWLVGEMERRFDVLKDFGARDIMAYNTALAKKKQKPDDEHQIMPYIVLIIDELADLMMAKGKEVEAAIVRISQLARAVGIHLIVATQRPSVEVITGLIKANITSRVAFQVASQVDSRTILDASGAEKLLGRGDMLFLSAEFSKPKRIQGSFLAASEIKKVANFIEKENKPAQKESLEQTSEAEAKTHQPEVDLDDVALEEPLYNDAKGVVMEYRKASASLLQRRLKIGYARAARIIDMLEQNGVVGPQEGSRPREVYADNQDGFMDAGEVESEYK